MSYCNGVVRQGWQVVCTRVSALIAGLSLIAGSAVVMAESGWRDPHPQRLDGFVEGREFLYNMESFLHRFSYRQLSDNPAPGRDGLWGTGGSISGDELYLEANLQKTLLLNNGRYGIIARMQRREDLDGRFDRQLLGVQRSFGQQWHAALVADISGDKGLVDFQFEATWRPSENRELRMALVQKDRLYNNKGNSDNKYERTPSTYFVHYQHGMGEQYGGDIAINYSPRSRYDNREFGQFIESKQLRVAASARFAVTSALMTEFDLKLENTDRDYQGLPVMPDQPAGDFSRRMQQFTWVVRTSSHPGEWQGGLRYIDLDESGWFGQNLASSGYNHRREAYAFFGGKLRQRDTNWWEPTLYVGNVDLDRKFLQSPADGRQEKRFVAKLSTAWRSVVHAQSGAILTVNPTLRLHSMNFGGGNVQLHWPL